MSDRNASENVEIISRIRQYRRFRRKFSFKVYILSAIFVIISLVQWIVCVAVSAIADFVTSFFYISMAFLFAALIVITLFTLWEALRFKFPINWILALLFVECMSLGLMAIFANYSVLYLFVCFAFSVVIVVGFIALGICISRDLTLDVVILFVFAIILFIGSVLFLTLALLADAYYSVFVFAIFVIAMVVMFLMYHGQTIHGSRYAEMRLKDFLLAALIIYTDFIILFTMGIFIANTLAPGALTPKTVVNEAGSDDFRRNCSFCETNITAVKFLPEK